MPIWTIRTRDDNGKDEKIKVRADDAGEAIALAEVDMRDVLSVKTKWGTWGGKHEGKYVGKTSVMQRLAYLVAIVYIIAATWGGSTWSTGFLWFMGVVIAFWVIVAISVLLIRRKRSQADEEPVQVNKVTERIEFKKEWWQSYWVAGLMLIAGAGMCVLAVVFNDDEFMQESGGFTIVPRIIPLFFLGLVAYNPRDFG